MDIDLFFRFLLNGIGNGAVYGSVALALVLIFRTTGLLNLAQGEMALFSTYFAWWLTAEQDLSIGLAIVIAVAASMVAGAVIERVLIRPVHGPDKSPLNVLIVMLGLFLALNALAQLLFTTDAQNMPKAWPSIASPGDPNGEDRAIELLGIRTSSAVIALAVALILECVLLYLLFQKTKLGLKLRAVASNPDSSRLVGINSSVMLMLGWALAAGLGAFAGSLVSAVDGRSVNPALMAVILVYSFSAAALGGFDSPLGAVVGGLIVAIADAFTIGYVDALDTIELVVPFGLIMLVLLVRPTGLFGRKVVERV